MSKKIHPKKEDQFQELMKEINYGIKQVKSKKFNLAWYYEHMADFFDYIGLPADAVMFKNLSYNWIKANSDKEKK